eukprot:3059841-Prymnesium_polylepis.1
MARPSHQGNRHIFPWPILLECNTRKDSRNERKDSQMRPQMQVWKNENKRIVRRPARYVPLYILEGGLREGCVINWWVVEAVLKGVHCTVQLKRGWRKRILLGALPAGTTVGQIEHKFYEQTNKLRERCPDVLSRHAHARLYGGRAAIAGAGSRGWAPNRLGKRTKKQNTRRAEESAVAVGGVLLLLLPFMNVHEHVHVPYVHVRSWVAAGETTRS